MQLLQGLGLERGGLPLSRTTNKSLFAMVRSSYCGDKRSLVLAFDIGTTFSGVSYVLLDPGQVPEINSVIRYSSLTSTMVATPLYYSPSFPGQTLTSSKIPSTVWYDSNGKARSFGAEAALFETIDKAEAEGWSRLDWLARIANTRCHTDRKQVETKPRSKVTLQEASRRLCTYPPPRPHNH